MSTDAITEREDDLAVAFSESLVPDAPSRIDELKQQLAFEYEALIATLDLAVQNLDDQIATLTEERKAAVELLRSHRRDLERLTGERPVSPERDTSSGQFPCPYPGCDRTFGSKQGVAMHNTRAHKPATTGRQSADRPMPSTSTRSVYRCGEVGVGADADPCGHEVRSLSDLSHHTLTAHRRQPTPAEKILVTPDR